ncbi:DegT/DnrJ/EryC1/StrS family aminotransferase [bacterium]|nr:DegT/DnrJ/EryC1/StrS family aminotransferase [bacterium]
MKVPFVDLKREANFCFDELQHSFERVIRSGNYINGPSVKSLENSVSEYLGVEHCVSVGNGSDALVFILRALDISDGDEVICPGNSFIATSWAIRAVGAEPIFCDVGEDLLFSAESFYSKVNSKTKAFIPVHLTGRVADIHCIRQFCLNHSIHIIEDAAQSFGAFDPYGSFTGSLGTAGAFSLHPLKNLAVYGDGGLITTNNSELAAKCRLLRNHGLEDRDSASIWGYNSRLDELQASFALVKLNHIEEWSSRYNEIAKFYDSCLCEEISKPIIRDKFRDVYHNYVVLVSSSIRNTLQKMLNDEGVDTKIHYPIPLHKQKCFTNEYGDIFSLPKVELYACQMISLPIYPFLEDAELQYICNTFNRLYSLVNQ